MAASPSSTAMTAALLPNRQPMVATSLPTNIGRALFGLKTGSMGGRVTTMTTYKVTLISKEHGTVTFECPSDQYMLDGSEEEVECEGLYLPYSCKAGTCCSCVGKVISGSVEQSDGSFLDDDKLEDGWVLTCVAYPTSDVTIETHLEDEFTNAA